MLTGYIVCIVHKTFSLPTLLNFCKYGYTYICYEKWFEEHEISFITKYANLSSPRSGLTNVFINTTPLCMTGTK